MREDPMTKNRAIHNVLIVAAVVAAAAGVLAMKYAGRAHEAAPVPAVALSSEAAEALPALVDLGAGKCIPCKMMAPILDELAKEYADRFSTTFYDVWEDPEPGERFDIRMIPTQVFLDPEGKELFRHEGFFGKEDILGKWKELGYDMQKGDG
jgi:thioredoxin 1